MVCNSLENRSPLREKRKYYKLKNMFLFFGVPFGTCLNEFELMRRVGSEVPNSAPFLSHVTVYFFIRGSAAFTLELLE